MPVFFRHPVVRTACAAAVLFVAACARTATVSQAPVAAKAPERPDGRSVLRAMYDRYVGKWYMTLTFKKNTVFISQAGRETKAVWNEYITLPGRLRIDYLPLASRSGVLYTDGKMYSFTNGKASAPQAGWNPMLVLMGDVYAQLPDTTAWQLDSLGFDLSVVRKDTVDKKEMWVVGAAKGDSTTSQFWVDTDSLLVRRIVHRDSRGARPVVNDTRFQSYRNVGGFPVAYQMRYLRDGRLYFREDYFNVKAGETLPVELFEADGWAKSQLKR
jgi:hypothetical protein